MEFIYNWHKYPNMMMLLLGVYFNMRNVLEKRADGETLAEEYIHDIEEYVVYLRKHGFDLNKVYDKLKYLLYVKPETFKDGMPPVINGDRCIILNENITGDDKLNAKENRRLYLYKALSKILFGFNDAKIVEFSKVFESTEQNPSVVNRGWDLIRDTLAEELAERATFEISCKPRPLISFGHNGECYPINGSYISSRLLHERAFDDILVNFGLTISGVGTMFDYSHDKMMNDLLSRAINHDLSDLIISEYIYKGNGSELYNLLYMMGVLVAARDHENMVFLNRDITETYQTLLSECQQLVTLDDDLYEDIPIVRNITRLG